MSGDGAYITDDGFMYSTSYFGVYVSKTTDPRNSKLILEHEEDTDTQIATRFDKIIAFSNGDIIVIEKILSNILLGVKNEASPFWDL